MDVCPTKTINERLELGKDCINCGLCLSKCPVGAIAGVSYSEKSIQPLINREEPIRLICQKCQPDSLWPCLGFLDPTLLLAFIFSKKDSNREVVIYQQDCRTCNEHIAQHLAWAVGEANRFLGPGKKMISNSTKKFSVGISRDVSRRQFFAKLWGASVSTVRNIAFPDSEDIRPIHRRQLFLSHGGVQLLPDKFYNQTTFKSLVVAKACNACGICANVCDTGAISMFTEDAVLEIRHNPALCNNCRICVSQCPQGAISLVSAYSLSEATVERIRMPVCTDCGKIYHPLGDMPVCIDCMQKKKSFSVF